jgi:hypothetical protein
MPAWIPRHGNDGVLLLQGIPSLRDARGADLGVEVNVHVRVSFGIERDTIDVGNADRALGGVVDTAARGVMSTENSPCVEDWEK